MEVHINEIASTVRAMDGDALLSPQTMEKILCAVLRAVEEREQYRDRVRAEQRITRGVSYELEETE
jgi:hypothetical protein